MDHYNRGRSPSNHNQNGRDAYKRDRDYREQRRPSRDRDREKHSRYRRSRSRSDSFDRDRIYNKKSEDSRNKNRDDDRGGYDRNSDDRNRKYRRSRSPNSNYNNKERRHDRDYRRHGSPSRSNRSNYSDSEESYGGYSNDDQRRGGNDTPNNKIIVRGLAPHLTEADINSDLINCDLAPLSIHLIRKTKTGASRGFAFVEFATIDEARRWMVCRKGQLILQDQYRATIQYTYGEKSGSSKQDEKQLTDWYCAKCGVFNFKRRENCFKCQASREESEKGGEGSDEVSNILTKKIIMRNLDTLTNEERILCKLQEVVPSVVTKISKILVCRDPLTQTSRGICYLHFDNLVDSMNLFNALKALEPPLEIDSREIQVSYCIDSENKSIERKESENKETEAPMIGPMMQGDESSAYAYTLADVPRLAEYSASLYAKNAAEQQYYLQYYTDYYTSQITMGTMSNFPTQAQMGEANNGAEVALQAIQRKQGKASGSAKTQQTVAEQIAMNKPAQIPKGDDGKKYPPPNPCLYDETSGYYYDTHTGLYYNPVSQYYYNNETGAFLYWDHINSTYITAEALTQQQQQSIAAASAVDETAKKDEKEETKKEKKGKDPQNKVQVAKKIVKDMERWAKQLNQKKDMPVMPSQSTSSDEMSSKPASRKEMYADVGFSILEKKDHTTGLMNLVTGAHGTPTNKLVSYDSGSDNDAAAPEAPRNEADYVDFEKLTCNLCKRAFQSAEILTKHLRMSQLHKENLAKYNLTNTNSPQSAASSSNTFNSSLSYRDRAKERRLKYGEDDPPPVNKTRERFERELERQQASYKPPPAKIGENNVGNKLLQKMGWTEGMGLGRSNQGRTDIIQAEQRNSTAGLGSKQSSYGAGAGDDYKSYIKKMMKARYESVE
ncbi:RNA-binding protein 5-like [Culicoides brevitarsis]|uniref:RNA-binding protein 5-like n=1 Tax=Culicoides brevitarsis TaxID=469753 RepID=UPI00307BE7ED